ncbi:hypothetical protein DICPUDRAFT_100099 [Dictyostelium purpureum]|uniref:Uncharacterized protein n=1 Tax=Dictyostelium purpureum TaxID=5786 RepID=F1A5G8_DICPU|nr:uncharacterized protein DICPUDRAFT_100099 [Dictyostelium purpureum]EGC28560.1 hypothetical protein DICPUDRAFT_100099 [Dictyostelium purpureum]|eukprot:XP_003294910.1 hypothetical protein DICPUDRAFT_100099 [Dictyostelium purpureum]
MSDDLLQQLQPLLLIDELKQHQIQSVNKQKQLKDLTTYNAKTIDQFMKDEHDYYSKKSKELKLLSSNFIARQNRLISQGFSISQEYSDNTNKTGDQVYEQQTQHVLQATALLIQEIAQTITIISTLISSIEQLELQFEFVVTHSLQQKLLELNNLSKHLSILLKELEKFSVSFSNTIESNSPLQLETDGFNSAVLVFTRQPFPGLIKRYKQMQLDELTIEMLTTSHFPYTYSKLKIIFENVSLNPSNATTSNNNNSNNNNSNPASQTNTPSSSPLSSSGNNNIPSVSDSNNNINNSNNNITNSGNVNIIPSSNIQDNNNNNNNINDDNQSLELVEQNSFDLFPSENSNRFISRIPLKFVRGTARFSKLKFSICLIHKVTKEQFNIETDLSESFIVFNNDSQWVDFFCELLKNEIFLKQDNINVSLSNQINLLSLQPPQQKQEDSPLRVSSEESKQHKQEYFYTKVNHLRVIKTIQKYFTVCLNIRKSLLQQYYPFPNESLQYLLNQISENIISCDEFDSFISILSPVFKVIKYQKNVIDLWNLGVIFTFISNDKVKELLLSNISNTSNIDPTKRFLIQFSENHPFCWVIKYLVPSIEPQPQSLQSLYEVREIYIDMKTDLPGDRSNKSILTFIETNKNLLNNLKEVCQNDLKQNQVRFIKKEEVRTIITN